MTQRNVSGITKNLPAAKKIQSAGELTSVLGSAALWPITVIPASELTALSFHCLAVVIQYFQVITADRMLGRRHFNEACSLLVRTLLKKLEVVKSLDRLSLANCSKVTDAGLQCLKGMQKLKVLNLRQTKITGEGLKYLPEATELVELYLGGTLANDSTLKQIQRFTQLQVLELDHTQISDLGLQHLKDLAQLKNLSLSQTRIGDKGVEALTGLTNIESLYLGNTGILILGQYWYNGCRPSPPCVSQGINTPGTLRD